MFGQLNWERKEVTVIGGGIAGLLAAHRLDRLGFEVTLIERSLRSGGLLLTEQTPFGLAEKAAHSLLATQAVRNHFQALGVPLIPTRKRKLPKWILRDQLWKRMPLKWSERFTALSRMARSAPDAAAINQMTIKDFAEYFLGSATHQYLIEPFLLGIYGCRTEDILISEAFPKMIPSPGRSLLAHVLIQKFFKSPGTPKPEIMTPLYGMQSWIQILSDTLRNRLGRRFRLGENIETLPKSPNLILTPPAYESALLLQKENPELSDALSAIQYVPLVTATVFFENRAIPQKPDGIGILIPPAEKHPFLGVLFNSSSFRERVLAEDRFQSFTVIMGGRIHPEMISKSDEQLRDLIESGFKSLMGINIPPIHVSLHRVPRAIPIYDHRLRAARETAQRSWTQKPGNILFGNYTGQVSLRGLIETVANWGESR